VLTARLPSLPPASSQAKKASGGAGATAEEIEAAAALKRTPEEQAKEEARLAAKRKYEEAQKKGEAYAEAMRLAQGKVRNKGITGSGIMKNRQSAKASLKRRPEDGDELAKRDGEREFAKPISTWVYAGAAVVLLSFLGNWFVQTLNQTAARAPVQQGPR